MTFVYVPILIAMRALLFKK